jgi:mRNA interferase MazF
MVRRPAEVGGRQVSIDVTRGEVWLVTLDPTIGSELRKTRPCVVISPQELHDHVRTVLAAPMTTGSRPAPFRVPIICQDKSGLILLDQLRALDKQRLVRRLGMADASTLRKVLTTLQETFAE